MTYFTLGELVREINNGFNNIVANAACEYIEKIEHAYIIVQQNFNTIST